MYNADLHNPSFMHNAGKCVHLVAQCEKKNTVQK